MLVDLGALVSHTHALGNRNLLDGDLGHVRILVQDRGQGGVRIHVHEFVDVEEEGPVGHEPRPKQAIVHH